MAQQQPMSLAELMSSSWLHRARRERVSGGGSDTSGAVLPGSPRRADAQRRVIDKLVGDEVMGLFIPLFIGEHVVRKMVEAGIELLEQTGAVGLEVGAGADFGIAYVGNVGEEEVKDFTALGDVVNTAARLQARAEPAQLILSERVYEAVRDRFPTLEPVELELKGKAEPVPATSSTSPGELGQAQPGLRED